MWQVLRVHLLLRCALRLVVALLGLFHDAIELIAQLHSQDARTLRCMSFE